MFACMGALSACLCANAFTPGAYVDYVGPFTIEREGSTRHMYQYVDTGVNAQSGTKAEFDIAFSVVDKDTSFLDARYDASNSGRLYLLHLYNNHFSYGYGRFVEISGHAVLADTPYHVVTVLESGLQSMVVTNLVTGEEVVNHTTSDTATYNFNTNLYLFACNYSGSYKYSGEAKLYGLKIWQKCDGDTEYNNSNLVRHYRPAVNWGEYAFHETVSDSFVRGVRANETKTPYRFRGPGISPICLDGPPDYLVEYVKGSGGAIDTGVKGRTGLRISTDMDWQNNGSEHTFLGAYPRYGERCYVIHKATPGNGNTQLVWTAYGDTHRGYPTNYTTGAQMPIAGFRRYHYEFDSTDPANVTLSVDGEYMTFVPDGSTTNLAADTGGYELNTTNITVFANNWEAEGWAWASSARCYTLKMWEDGELVRDFLPGIKDGKACLWDRVGNRVYMSLGDVSSGPITNELPLCAKEPEYYLDYIQSTGSEFINTGVRGRCDTKAEIEMEWCQVGSDWAFLDARASVNNDSSPNTRFFLWHTSQSHFAYGYSSYVRLDDTTVEPDTRYHVVNELAQGSQTLTVNGTVVSTGSSSLNVDAGCNLYVFVANIGDATPSYYSRARLYRLKLWQKDPGETDYVLLRDFRPAIAKDGTIGLWDHVGRIFYPSARNSFALNGAQVTGTFSGTMVLIR